MTARPTLGAGTGGNGSGRHRRAACAQQGAPYACVGGARCAPSAREAGAASGFSWPNDGAGRSCCYRGFDRNANTCRNGDSGAVERGDIIDPATHNRVLYLAQQYQAPATAKTEKDGWWAVSEFTTATLTPRAIHKQQWLLQSRSKDPTHTGATLAAVVTTTLSVYRSAWGELALLWLVHELLQI